MRQAPISTQPVQKSIVACVKCDSYDENTVFSAVRRGMDLLGGSAQFAKAHETILVKPNALSATDPALCVVTHPAVFKAVCSVMLETGCTLVYGDSPALLSGWGKCGPTMKKCGYSAIARQFGMAMADMDNGKTVTAGPKASYKSFVIANGVLASDGVVSLPKLKSHGLTRMTGAVKNQFGCVPGIYKGQYHARVPDVKEFSKLLTDITAFVRPRLYVLDAVDAMEGNGPQSGDPRHIGVLLFSTDPCACDCVAARIIGLSPESVPTNVAYANAGLGTMVSTNIEIAGDAISQFITPNFVVSKAPMISIGPSKIMRTIKNMLVPRPFIRASQCTRCGNCIRSCPVLPKAVDWKETNARKTPSYRYDRCIRCFCCQECCPSRAIRIQTPLLGKLLPFLSYISLLAMNMRMKREKRRFISRGRDCGSNLQ